MSGYECTNQEYIVGILESDTTLQGLIGGVEGAHRIFLAHAITSPPALTASKKAYIVVALENPRRSQESGNRISHRELMGVHVYTFMADRAFRASVVNRVKSLFLGKSASPSGQGLTFITEVNATEAVESPEKVVTSLYFNFDFSELVDITA